MKVSPLKSDVRIGIENVFVYPLVLKHMVVVVPMSKGLSPFIYPLMQVP